MSEQQHEPMRNGPWWAWTVADVGPDESHDLPLKLFDALPGSDHVAQSRRYPTREAAMDALATATAKAETT